jgi:hypothetical protein
MNNPCITQVAFIEPESLRIDLMDDLKPEISMPNPDCASPMPNDAAASEMKPLVRSTWHEAMQLVSAGGEHETVWIRHQGHEQQP